MKFFFVLILVVFLGNSGLSNASPAIFQAWQAKYTDSNSSEIACQLCHERNSGGDGWNPYGWSIREYLYDLNDINAAFDTVEEFNSDFDSEGLSNIVEIERSMYPGWINGNSNTIYFKEDIPKLNQPSPFYEVDPTKVSDELCFPIVGLTKTTFVICL